MEASKVAISAELLSKDLTRKQKTELRKRRALEFIKSKPNGSVIKQSEFVPVVGLSPRNISTFLATVERNGLIRGERVGRFETAFYVTDSMARSEPKAEAPKPDNDVVKLAKQYFWETQDDSLHKFVEWVAEIK